MTATSIWESHDSILVTGMCDFSHRLRRPRPWFNGIATTSPRELAGDAQDRNEVLHRRQFFDGLSRQGQIQCAREGLQPAVEVVMKVATQSRAPTHHVLSTRWRDFASLLALAITNFALSGCSDSSSQIRTYDDCVLYYFKGATTGDALRVIQASCKQKYPQHFDFDAIARSANNRAWREVFSLEQYASASDDTKQQIREQYFSDVIAPRVHPAFIGEAATQFEAFSRGLERSPRRDEKSIEPVPGSVK